MKIRNAVVPVAGIGTRLLPATKSQPKEMLPVGRKPIVQYVAEELYSNGLERMLFVTGRGKNSIEDHFDEDKELIQNLRKTGKEELLKELAFERMPIDILYIRQKQQNGLGDAVSYGESFTSNEPFVVALGDSIIGKGKASCALKNLCEAFSEHGADAAILFEEVAREQVKNYGIAKPKSFINSRPDLFEISGLIEKPSVEESPSNLAIAGRYVFTPQIFSALRQAAPDQKGEIQLTEGMKIMINEGAKVIGLKMPAGEKRYDIGNYKSYYETFIEFALADPEYGGYVREVIKEKLLK